MVMEQTDDNEEDDIQEMKITTAVVPPVASSKRPHVPTAVSNIMTETKQREAMVHRNTW